MSGNEQIFKSSDPIVINFGNEILNTIVVHSSFYLYGALLSIGAVPDLVSACTARSTDQQLWVEHNEVPHGQNLFSQKICR